MARSQFLDDAFGPAAEPKTDTARRALAGKIAWQCDNCGSADGVSYGDYSRPDQSKEGRMLCVVCLLGPELKP